MPALQIMSENKCTRKQITINTEHERPKRLPICQEKNIDCLKKSIRIPAHFPSEKQIILQWNEMK